MKNVNVKLSEIVDHVKNGIYLTKNEGVFEINDNEKYFYDVNEGWYHQDKSNGNEIITTGESVRISLIRTLVMDAGEMFVLETMNAYQVNSDEINFDIQIDDKFVEEDNSDDNLLYHISDDNLLYHILVFLYQNEDIGRDEISAIIGFNATELPDKISRYSIGENAAKVKSNLEVDIESFRENPDLFIKDSIRELPISSIFDITIKTTNIEINDLKPEMEEHNYKIGECIINFTYKVLTTQSKVG